MEPLFKVGDKVRVKERIGSKDDYKYSFIDEMAALAGEVLTIERILPDRNTSEKPVPDDNALYYMKESDYSWSSGMLEKAPSSSITVGNYHSSKSSASSIALKKTNKVTLNFNI